MIKKNYIPTINISSLLGKNFNTRSAFKTVKELEKACLDIGFFQITGHGIKLKNINKICRVGENFFKLKDDGNRSFSEKKISDYDPNTNFNLWNLDLSYDWEFSPGSKLSLLYRNNIFNEDNLSGISYYRSTKELFENPINHQLSLRINYFIDYNLLKKKKI